MVIALIAVLRLELSRRDGGSCGGGFRGLRPGAIMSGSTGPSGLDIADHMVRYLSADTHPDHDSIGKFRRESKELLASAFHQVLELAASAKELKVGGLTVSPNSRKPRRKSWASGAS